MTDAATLHDAAAPAAPDGALALAADLASHARIARDIAALIEAARVLRGVPQHERAPGIATPASLFAEARLMADGDPDLLAEIDWAQNDAPRTLRIVGGDYVQQLWRVARTGNGKRLRPTVTTLPPLRNSASLWSITYPLAV